jgi:hypothetical protein
MITTPLAVVHYIRLFGRLRSRRRQGNWIMYVEREWEKLMSEGYSLLLGLQFR